MQIFALFPPPPSPHHQNFYIICLSLFLTHFGECQLPPQTPPLGSLAMMKKAAGAVIMTKNYENRVNGGTVIEGSPTFTSHLLLQRSTSMGTDYYRLNEVNGRPPLYRRRVVDTNKQFVTFPDPLWPEGSGRYIVLKRVFVHLPNGAGGGGGGQIPKLRQHQKILRGEPVYQGFFLILSDSMHAYISKWSPPIMDDPGHKLAGGVMATDPKLLHHPTFDVEHEFR